jgi:hypothetical protein
MPRLTIALAILCFASAAQAQTPQQRAHMQRQAEIRRHNYAQAEAIRLLFGPNGLPALTRPADPWNARGYGYRGGMNYSGTNSPYGPGYNPSLRSPSFPHRYGNGSGYGGNGYYGTNGMNYYGTNNPYGPGYNPSVRSPSFNHRYRY